MRWRLIRMSIDALAKLFTSGEHHVRCVSGIPKGAKAVEIRVDSRLRSGAVLIIEHKSFDELKDGALIPEHPAPLFESIKVYPKETP